MKQSLLLISLLTSLPVACCSQRATSAPPDPAYEQVIDDPSLPRVLIIGDSVSLGYTLPLPRN